MEQDLWATWVAWTHQWGFNDPQQLAWVFALGLLALLGVLWRWLAQPGDADEPVYEPGNDQFALTAPINHTHIGVLQYLNRAFPEGMVLFRPTLARFVSVRKSRQRDAARRHLYKNSVDFLVCDEDGKPLVAFEVDAFRETSDPQVLNRLADKVALLKSAGIRLVRLKGQLGNLPTPAELRSRLYAAQQRDSLRGMGTASTFNQRGAAPSSFGKTELPSSFSDEVRHRVDAKRRAVPVNDASAWQLVGKRN